MSASVLYLQNALMPHERWSQEVQPCAIKDLAPVEWVHPFVAFVDGQPVLRADWELVLEDGQALAFIDVNAIPQGGGGGSDPMRVIASLAVIVFAPAIAAGMFYGDSIMAAAALGSTGMALFNAGAIFAGMALVNAVLPVKTAQSAAAMAAPSPTYSVGAQGNSARIGMPIPEQFGRLKVYPDFASQPYTEYSGNDQYLYEVLCLGRGSYDIEAINIFDTPISNYQEITSTVYQPGLQIPSTFPSEVVTSADVSGQDMSDATVIGPFITNAAGTSANYIGIDYVCNAGLYYANDDGSLGAKSLTVLAEIQSVDVVGVPFGSWTTLGRETISGSSNTPIRKSFKYAVTAGRYQVRVHRTDTKDTSARAGHSVCWAGMRAYLMQVKSGTFTTANSISTVTLANHGYSVGQSVSIAFFGPSTPSWTNPSIYCVATCPTPNTFTVNNATPLASGSAFVYPLIGDYTLITLKMLATNNLSAQANRQVNVICTRRIPTWNGAMWTAAAPSRSIAWAIAYACKAVGLGDAQIDLAGLRALDAIWTTRGDYFDGRFDSFINFWDAITDIAQAGRAKPFMQGGIMRVVRDQSATIPVTMFSTRNMAKDSFSVDYLMPTPDTADAVTVSYFDNTGWVQSTVSASLPDSLALQPAQISLFGVCGRDQAYREAMYVAGCNRYRRKMIKFTTEMEGFIPSFLDLVTIQHDMPGWGQSGEIVAWDAPSRTATLSEYLTWGTGTHSMYLRLRDGSSAGPYVVGQSSQGNQVVFAIPPGITPYVAGDEERTHYNFGWSNTQNIFARVLTVTPRSLSQVDILCVNEDANVHSADQGIFTPVRQVSQLAGLDDRPAVRGLVVTSTAFDRHAIFASWQASPGADHYVVQVSPDNVNWQTVASFQPVTNYSGVLRNEGTTYVRVAAVGLAQGPWANATLTVVGLGNVQGLAYSLTDAGILISWTQPQDLDYFDTTVKVGSSWATGTVIYTGSSNRFLWPRPGTGVFYIWAKHNDISGASSLTEQEIVINYTQNEVVNTAISLTPQGQLVGAGGGAIDLGSCAGTLGHAQFDDEVFILNLGGVDVDVELRFGRTTGGPASITWNGQLLQASKPFKPVQLGINNISATEPATPFAGQVWLNPSA